MTPDNSLYQPLDPVYLALPLQAACPECVCTSTSGGKPDV